MQELMVIRQFQKEAVYHQLFSLITGEDTGGTWSRLTGTGGTLMRQLVLLYRQTTTSTFKYLLSATSPCIADESIATVNVNNQPDAGTDGNTTVWKAVYQCSTCLV
jgi:valyl-tRNA synthetase